MTAANVIAAFLILTISVCGYLAVRVDSIIYIKVSDYLQLAF